MPKPVKLGRNIEILIEDITHQGEGVAKLEGYTIFVPYTAPGDRIIAKVVGIKKNYAQATIEQIIIPGQRINPKCPWYQECGGCNLQHLDYLDQLQAKTKNVQTTLQRVGGICPNIVLPTLPTRPWNYRNKLQAPVGLHAGQLAAGLYKPRSHDLVPVTDCSIQHSANNAVAQEITIIVRNTGITAWNKETHAGTLRHVIVRHSEATSQTLATLVVSSLDFPNRAEFLKQLKEQLADINSLVLNENSLPTTVILGEREEIIWGQGYITDKIGGLKFKISPRSFWQVNPDGAEKIYEKVREYAQLTGNETVLDIYCGTGSIGLFLANQAKRIIGIVQVAGIDYGQVQCRTHST